MEESNLEKSVRERLVISGLKELHEHGIADFSLRRVAIDAQVSCAAPYRHFKDKNELIGAIIEYIASRWRLLCREISSAFSYDKGRLVLELSVASLRFWIANGSFRTILMTADVRFADMLAEFDKPIDEAVVAYFAECTDSISSSAADCIYTIHALISGTVLLITQGRLSPSAAAVDELRRRVSALLY